MVIKKIYPSPDLETVIEYYEYMKFLPFEGIQKVTCLPCFMVGFVFILNDSPYLESYNKKEGKFKLISNSLVPPTSIPTINELPADLCIIRPVFKPGLLNQIFGTPLHAFTDMLIPLEYSMDKALKDVHEKIYLADSLESRIQIFETYLRQKLNGKRIKTPLYKELANLKTQPGLLIKVQDIADQVGLTRQQLNRRIKAETGFNAKTFFSIQRFNEVMRHIHSSVVVSISEVAYQFGYSDQAHFTHEFKRMTGHTPGEYLKAIGKRIFHGDIEELTQASFLRA